MVLSCGGADAGSGDTRQAMCLTCSCLREPELLQVPLLMVGYMIEGNQQPARC
jgi:hypothetical protein